ncbi:hypothetical protein JOF56_002832 [Kibdelosporangium banguiense]|uniref:DUF2017 domain-containing protein n=1 Tax=Kibdelosporangium banguiense TaxID=1365924 RepID=A0ABS4TDF1_9PSEU|nr:DUF2017 family protein [Kibdelosporangium banguiense]MBP2322447.1 hypothetical protein [Kibdelosporangium banguiense]
MDVVHLTVCWDRADGDLIGVFSPHAVSWLRRQMTGYRELLEWRYTNYVTDDPTANAIGVPLASTPAEYPPLVAALREIIPDEEPEAIRLWWEPDVVRWLYAGTQVVLNTLPESGGVVVLRERHEIEAWQAAVPNMRVVFAVAAGIWPVPAGTEHNRHSMPKLDPDRHRPDRALTQWLRRVVDGLTEIASPAPTS